MLQERNQQWGHYHPEVDYFPKTSPPYKTIGQLVNYSASYRGFGQNFFKSLRTKTLIYLLRLVKIHIIAYPCLYFQFGDITVKFVCMSWINYLLYKKSNNPQILKQLNDGIVCRTTKHFYYYYMAENLKQKIRAGHIHWSFLYLNSLQ